MTMTEMGLRCDACRNEYFDSGKPHWKFSIKHELELSHAYYMKDFHICTECRNDILRQLKRPAYKPKVVE